MKFTIVCPKCKKKGLHYANHEHAFGWKNYDVVECRFCHSRYDAESVTNAQDVASKVGKEADSHESQS